MDYTVSSKVRSAGISEGNRRLLSQLHQKTSGPFTVSQAAELWNTDRAAAGQLLAYLVSRGWLARVRRGLYVTVPLEASTPDQWREDPWIVAATLFDPGYIGGWSACEHWGLTEQIFREVIVFTARRLRDRQPVIQGTSFRIKVVPKQLLFGTRTVWRRQVRVQVSDPSRTVVDILDDPRLGGGMRQVTGVVATYLRGEHREEQKLLEYAKKVGNRTVYKRLGYLIETLGVDLPQLLQSCRERMSSGDTLFDPSVPSRGQLKRRWNLWVNARINPAEYLA